MAFSFSHTINANFTFSVFTSLFTRIHDYCNPLEAFSIDFSVSLRFPWWLFFVCEFFQRKYEIKATEYWINLNSGWTFVSTNPIYRSARRFTCFIIISCRYGKKIRKIKFTTLAATFDSALNEMGQNAREWKKGREEKNFPSLLCTVT